MARQLGRHGLDRCIDYVMELLDNAGDVGLFPVLLEAHVDDVDRIPIRAVSIDSIGVDARLELLEHLPAHDLETLAGFIILVGRFLAGDNGGIAGETSLLDHVVQRCAAVL